MDKEILQNRIKDLLTALDQAKQQYYSIQGRIEESQYMLQQLDIQHLVDEGEEV